jgi:hypothetical protein
MMFTKLMMILFPVLKLNRLDSMIVDFNNNFLVQKITRLDYIS